MSVHAVMNLDIALMGLLMLVGAMAAAKYWTLGHADIAAGYAAGFVMAAISFAHLL